MITSLDKNTVLVLIDLQNGIVNLPLATPVIDVIQNAVLLITAFRKVNLPIVFVNVDPRTSPLNILRKDSKQTPMELKEDWFELIPELQTRNEDIFITKNSWNAFSNPELDLELKRLNITGMVLAGVATSVGVEGTARAAIEKGYNTTFAIDAMTDMFVEAHRHSITYIFSRLGELGSTTEIIDMLETKK